MTRSAEAGLPTFLGSLVSYEEAGVSVRCCLMNEIKTNRPHRAGLLRGMISTQARVIGRGDHFLSWSLNKYMESTPLPLFCMSKKTKKQKQPTYYQLC